MKNCLRLLVLCGMLIYAANTLFAQPLTGVSVSPTPVLNCSTTLVAVNGFLPCGNATIQGTSHTYSGTTLFVDVFITQPIICLPVILPYSVTEIVGNIPAGSYTLTVRYFENGLNLANSSSPLNVGSCCAVNSGFTASSLTACPGDSLSFTASDPALASYTWTLGGNVISSTSTAGFIFPATGSFALQLEAGDGACTTTTTQTIQITQPQLTFAQVNGESCPGTQNGSIDLQVTGGTAPYTYAWSNGSSTQDLTQLSTGNYVVTVSDNLGCVATDSATVAVGIPVVAGFSTSSFSKLCTGDSASFINTATGATQYEWFVNGQPFAQTADAGYAFADTGSLTISLIASNATCADTSSSVFQVSAPLLSATTTDEACTGSLDGAIDLTSTAGILPYSFAWSNGATMEDLNQLAGGTYFITVTDSLGCATSDTVTVATAVGVMAQFTASDASPICPGETLDFTNGSTPGTTTQWLSDGTPFATTADASLFFPDSGTVEITLIVNLGVCADTMIQSFSISSAPEVAVQLTDETCPGSETGAVGLTLSGGAGPFLYNWSNGATTENLSSLSAGTYSLLLTFGTDCEWRDTFELVTLGGLSAAFSHEPAGNALQFTDLSDSTATTWSWDFGDGLGSSNAQNPTYTFLWPGNYEVCLAVADQYGCVDTLCQTITYTTGIENHHLLSLSGYPNPAKTAYYLDLRAIAGEAVHVQLFDLAGRLVQERREAAETRMTLELASLASGLYHLVLFTETGYFETKIHKQ